MGFFRPLVGIFPTFSWDFSDLSTFTKFGFISKVRKLAHLSIIKIWNQRENEELVRRGNIEIKKFKRNRNIDLRPFRPISIALFLILCGTRTASACPAKGIVVIGLMEINNDLWARLGEAR